MVHSSAGLLVSWLWILCVAVATADSSLPHDALDVTLQLSSSQCIGGDAARSLLATYLEAPHSAVQLLSASVLGQATGGPGRQNSRRLLQESTQQGTRSKSAAQAGQSILPQPAGLESEAPVSQDKELRTHEQSQLSPPTMMPGQLCQQLLRLRIQPEQVQLLDTLASAVADDSLQQQLSKAGLVVYSSALLTPYERIYSRSALRNMR